MHLGMSPIPPSAVVGPDAMMDIPVRNLDFNGEDDIPLDGEGAQ